MKDLATRKNERAKRIADTISENDSPDDKANKENTAAVNKADAKAAAASAKTATPVTPQSGAANWQPNKTN